MLQMQFGYPAKLLSRTLDLLDLLLTLGDELVHPAVEYRVQYVVLALEVEINSPIGNAGGRRDVRDLGVKKAFAREDLSRRLENSFPLIGYDGAGRRDLT